MAKVESVMISVDYLPLKAALEDMRQSILIMGVAGEVIQEIGSARDKHGIQNHLPDGDVGSQGTIVEDLIAGSESLNPDNLDIEEVAKRFCENKPYTWEKILTEEWAEAMSCDHQDDLRAELIQVAAMAASWVLAIDSRKP